MSTTGTRDNKTAIDATQDTASFFMNLAARMKLLNEHSVTMEIQDQKDPTKTIRFRIEMEPPDRAYPI